MSTSKTQDWVGAVIIDDDSESEDESNVKEVIEITPVSKRKSKNIINNSIDTVVTNDKHKQQLKSMFDSDTTIMEIGIDEAGRGPMFGRVYAGAVVLPKDDSFEHSLMKDSKKFHSKKKIVQVSEYIKANAIAWAIEYEDEQTIDKINILQATQSAMHKCIKKILEKLKDINYDKILLLIDGNYFKPFTILNTTKTKLETIKYHMIEGGDNKYTSIAASSILAKVERDKYINEMCEQYPELIEHYGIDSNKGYGSKKHLDGIKQHGITKWHRKTFGICKEYC